MGFLMQLFHGEASEAKGRNITESHLVPVKLYLTSHGADNGGIFLIKKHRRGEYVIGKAVYKEDRKLTVARGASDI